MKKAKVVAAWVKELQHDTEGRVRRQFMDAIADAMLKQNIATIEELAEKAKISRPQAKHLARMDFGQLRLRTMFNVAWVLELQVTFKEM